MSGCVSFNYHCIYNTSQQNSIKITSYFLIYNRIVRLSIKGEMLSKNILLNKIITLIHKVLIFRENAKTAIKKV